MQIRTRSTPAVVAALLLATVACAESPITAPPHALATTPARAGSPDHEIEEMLYDLDGVLVPFGCSDDGSPLAPGEGELVRLTGQLYEKTAVRRDANGGVHVTIQTMPVGMGGTGETSGEEFRVKEQGHAAYGQTHAGSNGSWRETLTLTGRVSGRTFSLIVSGNYRLSAEGEVVVERDGYAVACKPARG